MPRLNWKTAWARGNRVVKNAPIFFIMLVMSFALEVKREILAKTFAPANALALLAGLTEVAGTATADNTYTLRLVHPEIALGIQQLATQLNLAVTPLNAAGTHFVIAGLIPPKVITLPAYYFAGAFIGGGSLADLSASSYHLEIQSPHHFNAERLLHMLNHYHFGFHLIQRRKMWVLYLKKSEAISDFLRALEAFNALLAFENARIERDFKNQLNRYSNLDVYNQSKLAKASALFRKYYNFILKQHLEAKFTADELAFFELKKAHPLSSLDELRALAHKQFHINKTRGGLNHWLLKLRRIYQDNHDYLKPI